jgi:hypothetical protein
MVSTGSSRNNAKITMVRPERIDVATEALLGEECAGVGDSSADCRVTDTVTDAATGAVQQEADAFCDVGAWCCCTVPQAY